MSAWTLSTKKNPGGNDREKVLNCISVFKLCSDNPKRFNGKHLKKTKRRCKGAIYQARGQAPQNPWPHSFRIEKLQFYQALYIQNPFKISFEEKTLWKHTHACTHICTNNKFNLNSLWKNSISLQTQKDFDWLLMVQALQNTCGI